MRRYFGKPTNSTPIFMKVFPTSHNLPSPLPTLPLHTLKRHQFTLMSMNRHQFTLMLMNAPLQKYNSQNNPMNSLFLFLCTYKLLIIFPKHCHMLSIHVSNYTSGKNNRCIKLHEWQEEQIMEADQTLLFKNRTDIYITCRI